MDNLFTQKQMPGVNSTATQTNRVNEKISSQPSSNDIK